MIKYLAKFLARPAVFAFIQRTFRESRGHLYGKNGTLYMGRWSVIDEFVHVPHETVSSSGTPLPVKATTKRTIASRVLQFFTGYASARLHFINRADLDRDLHNHPFTYRTFVLKGWYCEQLPDRARVLVSGDTSRYDGFHRIAEISPGGVWTLFCMTPNTGEWGFEVSGRFVPSKVYFKARGDK